MPPATPIRQQVLSALRDRLEEIAAGDTYHTDAGQSVRIGNDELSQDDLATTPAALALIPGESPETLGRGATNRVLMRLPFAVEGLARVDDAEDPFVADRLLADVKRALLRPDGTTLGGLLAEPLGWTGERVRYRTQGGGVASCRFEGVATYAERYGDPGAQ